MKKVFKAILGAGLVFFGFFLGSIVVVLAKEACENRMLLGATGLMILYCVPWVFGWTSYKLVKKHITKN
jgi:uncharacterized membrane protein